MDLPAEVLPDQLTFADLKDPLAEVGIDSRYIKAMEIDHDRATGGLVLVVTSLDLNNKGEPYESDLTGTAAVEVQRFPLTYLAFEAE